MEDLQVAIATLVGDGPACQQAPPRVAVIERRNGSDDSNVRMLCDALQSVPYEKPRLRINWTWKYA